MCDHLLKGTSSPSMGTTAIRCTTYDDVGGHVGTGAVQDVLQHAGQRHHQSRIRNIQSLSWECL